MVTEVLSQERIVDNARITPTATSKPGAGLLVTAIRCPGRLALEDAEASQTTGRSNSQRVGW